jgi:hypothetical protein
MKTLKMNLICLPALALLLILGAADEAQARIRVKATVRTPYGVVQVDNGAHRQGRGYRRALPARQRQEFRLTKKDKKVARRLGRYTGVPKRELLQMKRMGYSWGEIGNWLGVSHKAVRAAKSQHKWERFLKRQRRGGYCEVGGYYNH